MSIQTREARLERRIADLYAHDEQFAAAKPDYAISTAADQPGLRLPDVVRTVLQGYADRPALGQRAVEYVTDGTGRTTARAAAALRHRQLRPAVGARPGLRRRPARRTGPAR